MGSASDWTAMQAASNILDELGIAHECKVLSAHRSPHAVVDWVEDASKRGAKVFIAGAGMAAALPGVVAALTHLPVLGVPLDGSALQGLDALLAIVQMPKGIPVGTLAIGKHGALNAALLAASILSLSDAKVRERLLAYRAAQTQQVLDNADPTKQSK
ncbi:MAG: 5-(carboxyamino)imidazole ribonucleotide mutase [Phycisphaerales bacterium]|nr:5-(carboxyamino)imidazole ribonucleotide mutase [Phycisphaerales bacterium]